LQNRAPRACRSYSLSSRGEQQPQQRKGKKKSRHCVRKFSLIFVNKFISEIKSSDLMGSYIMLDKICFGFCLRKLAYDLGITLTINGGRPTLRRFYYSIRGGVARCAFKPPSLPVLMPFSERCPDAASIDGSI